MPRKLIELGASRSILDIGSYARRGPADRVHLTQEEIQLLGRTVRRTPEVMVKVLTKGGQDRKAIGRHLNYLSRDGELEIETDDGRRLGGEVGEQELLEDWDLDLEEARRTRTLSARPGIAQPKLAHKIVLSMPAGTPPDGLETASEASSRESLLHTRKQVERGWLAAAEILDRQGQQDLAWYVRRFTETLPPVRTDRELLRRMSRPDERRPREQELTR